MPNARTFRSRGQAGRPNKFMAHSRFNAVDITQGIFGTISYTVEYQDGTVTANGVALTVSSVVFNSLQTPATDPDWTVDALGYNFMAILPATAFPNEGDYVVRFDGVPTGFSAFTIAKFYHHCDSLT